MEKARAIYKGLKVVLCGLNVYLWVSLEFGPKSPLNLCLARIGEHTRGERLGQSKQRMTDDVASKGWRMTWQAKALAKSHLFLSLPERIFYWY